MEQLKSNERVKAPRVPIKTYKWEDLRRSRLKGGYPWTYLYKDPYDDNIDPEQFKMSEIPKSRSVSTLDKSMHSVDILEVPSDGHSATSQENITEPSSYIVITEVPSDVESHSKSETKDSLNIHEETEMNLLRADSESSDNISQYLDKDEPDKQPIESVTTMEVDTNRQERSKSEEPKRKRKHSIESSYSRKSLSKLAIMKKLKGAADKIKVPKLTLSKTKQTKQEEKPKPEPTNTSKPMKVDEKPVYIHIPLKPPPGETDEFSYLEFEEKKPPPTPPIQVEVETKSATNSNRSSRIQEEDEEVKEIESPTKIEELPPNYDQRRFSGDPNEIVAIEIVRAQSIDLDSTDIQKDLDNLRYISNDPNATQDDVIIILSETDENGKPKEKSLSRQSSKRSSTRRGRAKSAEPERKRKLSLESSYSRKSLSKLAFLQKLRDAKEKLKISNLLSRSNSKKQSKTAGSENDLSKTVEVEKDVKKLETPKKDEPKYIHIPLKPPPGQTDEFSYLEFEEKPQPVEQPSTTADNKQEEIPESPVVEQGSGVQFIVLTPPSDDEILDSATDVPDTPTNESQFELDEYKKIAQGAVERVSPESKKKLEIVKEEQQDAESRKIEEIPTEEKKIPETVKIEEKIEEESDKKIEVDEEDGLKLSEPVVTKQEQELKSSLKSDGILKKKVSFKRRSRDESKDGIYEDVEPRKDESNLTDEQKNKLQNLGTSQSMSVDEEKTYLDEKIIKSTSLEEDYNRWSKISDHEYEPVNPPPDNVSPPPPPVIEISPEKPVSQTQEPPPVVEQEPALTIQEIQTQIEEKFFKTPTPSPPPSVQSPPKDTETDNKTETETKEPSKFQQALKNQADKFKSKLVSIKKPTITMPSRPKFDKTKFEKFTKFETPKFHLPKIPDTAKIHLPTFNTTRKTITTTKTKTKPTSKRSLKQRQFSTESNMGDSKRNYFDFSTYPRIFKKKPKKQQDSIDSSSSKDDRPEFATVPRTKWNRGNESWTTGSSTQNDRWGGRDTIRIPLHGEESFESNDRDGLEESVASHIRYDRDIDNDDAYERENQQIHTVSPFSDNYNSRWNHGTFHPETTIEPNQITDLDSPEDESIPQPNFERDKPIRDVHSSESSLGIHRRGVLEEIDSDEFFLRQKGISQDNIEVGMYLSSEIREAFKSPTNALSDLQNDIRTSNQSLPETTTTKKKSIKKPKRKKTPHVSQEHLSYDQDNSDSEQFTEDIVPARPKRRSKRSKKQRDQENVIPYQETIALDVEHKKNEEESIMYENQQMEGKEHPEIQVIDPYAELQSKYEQEEEVEEEEEIPEIKPEAPPRRHRSLKSLNYSEHDSIMDDIDLNKELTQNVNLERIEHEYIIPTPDRPPMRPSRLHSRSSSNSRDINREFINQIEEAPIRPARTRSQSRARSQIDDDLTSRGGESLCSEPVPCVEEPCCQDLRDYMGYAIIDKQQRREPPLPPPRSSSRTKQTPHRRFFTVARTTDTREPPVRPLRNYSTLGPNRPPRRKLSANMTDEEKQSVENIDIIQYIEIEDEPNRDLNSGEIVQKMRDRPLPAPPRPPRKIKHDHDLAELEAQIVEVEVSTQTDNEDHNDTSTTKPEVEEESVHVERKLITPTHYSYEETITHGSLVVEPLNGAQILPDSQLIKPKSQERIVPVTRTYDDEDEETSEIPEDFKRLKNPPPPQERPVSVLTDHEVEIVKTQKLQVSDLDVDRLSVNELMANKIIVSEIESSNLHTNEINSRTGAVKIGEIELPPSVVQQLVEKLQSLSQEQATNVDDKETENEEIGQKKTPIDENVEPSLIKSPIESQEHSESIFDEITQITQTTSPPDVEQIQEQAENIEEPPEIPAISDPSDNQIFTVEETIDENIEILTDEEERLLEELKQEAELSGEEPLEMLQENIEQQQEIPSEQDIVTELQYEPNERSPQLSEEIQQNIDEELPETPPQRPPRSSEKPKPEESDSNRTLPRMQELELDDEPQPPPRPPQPPSDYVPSQPPASFYALRAQQYVDNIDDDIPIVPRRRRHYKTTASRASRSSSDDDDNNNNQRRPSSRRRYKSPEPTIPQLTGQLMNACCTAANSNLKRLIVYITRNYLGNIEHNDQDLNVLIVILLILIAGLILLGYGDGKTVHHHHWEYFNPPRDM